MVLANTLLYILVLAFYGVIYLFCYSLLHMCKKSNHIFQVVRIFLFKMYRFYYAFVSSFYNDTFFDKLQITHMEMIKGIKGHGYYDELVIPIIENTAYEYELTESLAKAVCFLIKIKLAF